MSEKRSNSESDVDFPNAKRVDTSGRGRGPHEVSFRCIVDSDVCILLEFVKVMSCFVFFVNNIAFRYLDILLFYFHAINSAISHYLGLWYI